MSGTPTSPFLLIACREGGSEFVKNEIATRFLGAKFSFSRPGFFSFKRADVLSSVGSPKDKDWEWASTAGLLFPLRSALFVGKWVLGKGFSFPPSHSNPDWIDGVKAAFEGGTRFHAMDFRPQGKRKASPTVGRNSDETTAVFSREEFEADFPGCFEASVPSFFSDEAAARLEWNTEAGTGDAILQAFAVSDTEVWFGWSRLRGGEFGWPGGESRVALPPEAPSRAYLKLVEAITLLEKSAKRSLLAKDDRAIEVGSAPGGAVYALLQRGLRVTGVDRGAMAANVLSDPRFTRVDSSVGDWMFPESLRAEWFLMDMNAEARIALRECKPVIEYVKRDLKGVFLTLKLNRVEFALTTERLAKSVAKDLGLKRFFVRQLPSSHQEIALFGITEKGSR